MIFSSLADPTLYFLPWHYVLIHRKKVTIHGPAAVIPGGSNHRTRASHTVSPPHTATEEWCACGVGDGGAFIKLLQAPTQPIHAGVYYVCNSLNWWDICRQPVRARRNSLWQQKRRTTRHQGVVIFFTRRLMFDISPPMSKQIGFHGAQRQCFRCSFSSFFRSPTPRHPSKLNSHPSPD